MATSDNPIIQKCMDAVDTLNPNDEDLEQKLQTIAEAIAAEQAKAHPKPVAADVPVDPADAFACDGCQ